jgi:biopolymer transport protein ExbB/TolQ
VNFEDAESKKLLELHSAMKVLNSNFQKVNRDSKDRFELLQKEFQVFDNALKNQLQDARHKADVEMRAIEERMEQTIAKYIARLQNGDEKLIIGGGSINNLELDIMLNSLKEELKAYTERVVF